MRHAGQGESDRPTAIGGMRADHGAPRLRTRQDTEMTCRITHSRVVVDFLTPGSAYPRSFLG